MSLGFARNPISHGQSICPILITFSILTNNIFINARKVLLRADGENTDFSQSTTKFTVDFLGAVIKENMNDRMVFSSFSIQICLGVIDLAVDLETAIKLNKYLVAHKALGDILQLYGKNNSQLSIANKLFYKEGSSVLDSFKYDVTTYFHSTSDEVYIVYNTHLQAHMSSWLESEGNPSTVTTFTVQSNGERRLLFLTSMNFNNEWLHKFSKNDTKVEWFIAQTKNGSVLRHVQTMNIVGYFDCASLMDLKAHVIKLPFSDKRMSMLILVPHYYSDVYELQNQLTVRGIKEILDRLSYREVSVKLPKFIVDGSVHYTDTLSNMGLQCIYCAKMHVIDNREFMRVESIVQKNKFIINEAGINKQNTAPTLGAGTSDYNFMMASKTPPFHANRAFIFFIQDNEGHTFYAGKVTDFV